MPEPATAQLNPSRNILARTGELGLRVVTYINQTTEPHADGSRYWIPRDCVATDGKAGIFWRMDEGGRRDVPGATYGFDGWEPWADGPHGTMFGGRYRTYESALAWMETVMEIRAGKRAHF